MENLIFGRNNYSQKIDCSKFSAVSVYHITVLTSKNIIETLRNNIFSKNTLICTVKSGANDQISVSIRVFISSNWLLDQWFPTLYVPEEIKILKVTIFYKY